MHRRAMPLEHRSIAARLYVPEPNRRIKASAGHRTPIRAPRQAKYLAPMSLKCLETAEAFHVPQFDGPIPTRAGELCAIGSKRQSPHHVGMPHKDRNTGGRLCCLQLPQPNASIEAATGEQMPIWTLRYREDWSGMRQSLQECTRLRIPEPDGRLIPTAAGKCASIGSKGQAEDAAGVPHGPERGPTL